MRLRCEVHKSIERSVAQQRKHAIAFADVAMFELDGGYSVEVGAVAGVGERVEHDDDVVWMALTPATHEVYADEAGATGDEQTSHI